MTTEQFSDLKSMWTSLFPDQPLSSRQWALWGAMHRPETMKEGFIALAKRVTKLEERGETMPLTGMLAYASSVMNRLTFQGQVRP
jgi:hypothetical protein